MAVKARTIKYDELFRRYSIQYFGTEFDWRWFKAQAIAESNLNPSAISPCGARGLMQIMPATFRGISRIQPWLKLIDDPEQNIEAGIFYDHKMYHIWSLPRPEIDRITLMFASYNAGPGTILRAQKLCTKDKNLWSSIVSIAKRVPNWRDEETMGYIARIMKLMGEKEKVL